MLKKLFIFFSLFRYLVMKKNVENKRIVWKLIREVSEKKLFDYCKSINIHDVLIFAIFHE